MNSEEIMIDGLPFLSSKGAALLTGYSQDYVGQLARTGEILGKRVGGLWYVSKESLMAYVASEGEKENRSRHEPAREEEDGEDTKSLVVEDPVALSTALPVPRVRKQNGTTDSIIQDDVELISVRQAAKLTNYHQDYIGQLARGGKITAKLIGRRWYVHKDSLLQHQKEKEEEMARIQVRSVGLSSRQVSEKEGIAVVKAKASEALRYKKEENDLIPNLVYNGTRQAGIDGNISQNKDLSDERYYIDKQMDIESSDEKSFQEPEVMPAQEFSIPIRKIAFSRVPHAGRIDLSKHLMPGMRAPVLPTHADKLPQKTEKRAYPVKLMMTAFGVMVVVCAGAGVWTWSRYSVSTHAQTPSAVMQTNKTVPTSQVSMSIQSIIDRLTARDLYFSR